MTAREEFERYFLTRALAWRDTLDDFDAETVAEIMKLMNKLQREIRGELFDNADSLTDFRRVRIEQLDEWLSEVLGGAALTTSSFITEAAVIAAMSSLTEYNAMMSLNGASSVVQTVGFTREQLVTWFQDTDIFEGMKLTTRVQNAMSAGVKQSILDSLRKAGLEGKGTREAVRGVIQSALDEGFTITEREAVTLTRSYIQAANVGAMDAVMEANRELLRGWRWAATLDTRTCFLCASLDGKMYKLGEESPPMPRHFNCLTGETPVFAPDKVAAFVSTYCGPVFEIVLSSGASFTATANHMFLTPDGFSPAKSLYKGQEIFFNKSRSALNMPVGKFAVCPNNNGNPTRIDEVVKAFSKTSGVRTVRVPASPEDLHGDMEFGDGYVDIIASDSFLRGDFEAFRDEFVNDFPFVFADSAEVSFSAFGDLFDERFWLWNDLHCCVGGDTIFEIFSRSPFGHHDPIGFSMASNHDRIVNEDFSDCRPTYAKAFSNAIFGLSRNISFNNAGDRINCFEMPATSFSPTYNINSTLFESCKDIAIGNAINLSDIIGRFASFVPCDHVVKINKRDFSGHVYDLQTLSSLYYANGSISSNCRCIKQWITNNPRDWGVPDDEVQRVIRPWVEREPGSIGTGGRKILNAGTTKEFFGGWWKTLPQAKQDAIVGPTRAALLRDGSISWDDLVEKKTGHYRTLKELGFTLTGEAVE